ncbi:efflux RND transporter periplasmic adaptor subunit [Duganella sp. BuS-21]|uniref:efflux RND transporter periplasmic adaptor subunit n=1 Tax=Duganella sp. BuS-21 TaxID=2943848 RepID=UPI0035A5F515
MLRTTGTVAILTAIALLAACSKSTTEAPRTQQVAEVGVFRVAQEALQITTELPGRTAAYQVAEVRPQVSGLIKKRLFVEGADVKAGVPLYQIDAATYQASYNAARAALSKAKANLLTAAPKVARYKELVAIEGVSRQDYEDAIAAHEQAKADVESAAAALEQAKINLDYTHVDAPISGRISRSTVTPGALVTANQTTALTTVQQLDPIYVDVTQSSEDMLRLKREIENGGLKKNGGLAKVTLLLSDGSKYAEEGKLQFSDVSVDPGTGNVTLRALFPNPKHDLLPGMFVRAVIESGLNEHAIAVPQQGVTRNPKGEATALVLNKEGKVEQRILVTGSTLGAKWLVKSGLNEGDLLIVEGVQKVKPGAPANAAKPAAAVAAGSQPAAAKSAQ